MVGATQPRQRSGRRRQRGVVENEALGSGPRRGDGATRLDQQVTTEQVGSGTGDGSTSFDRSGNATRGRRRPTSRASRRYVAPITPDGWRFEQ